MAILGFSHITSEVTDIDSSIKFYRDKGFQLKFRMEMAVPPCKRPILKYDAKKVKLAYLIFKADEACNLELIEHDTAIKAACPDNEKMRLCFFTPQADSKMRIKDPDGNEINVFPVVSGSRIKTRHYILPAGNLSATARFYEENFNMRIEEKDILREFCAVDKRCASYSLGFKGCLLTNWDGCLHLIEDKDLKPRKRYLNELGFHSFCFLASSAKKDIYSKLGRGNIIGPMREEKQVNGKRTTFEVGFVYNPDGYPIEYLLAA